MGKEQANGAAFPRAVAGFGFLGGTDGPICSSGVYPTLHKIQQFLPDNACTVGT